MNQRVPSARRMKSYLSVSYEIDDENEDTFDLVLGGENPSEAMKSSPQGQAQQQVPQTQTQHQLQQKQTTHDTQEGEEDEEHRSSATPASPSGKKKPNNNLSIKISHSATFERMPSTVGRKKDKISPSNVSSPSAQLKSVNPTPEPPGAEQPRTGTYKSRKTSFAPAGVSPAAAAAAMSAAVARAAAESPGSALLPGVVANDPSSTPAENVSHRRSSSHSEAVVAENVQISPPTQAVRLGSAEKSRRASQRPTESAKKVPEPAVVRYATQKYTESELLDKECEAIYKRKFLTKEVCKLHVCLSTSQIMLLFSHCRFQR